MKVIPELVAHTLEFYIPPGFKLQYIHSQLNLKSTGVMNKIHGVWIKSMWVWIKWLKSIEDKNKIQGVWIKSMGVWIKWLKSIEDKNKIQGGMNKIHGGYHLCWCSFLNSMDFNHFIHTHMDFIHTPWILFITPVDFKFNWLWIYCNLNPGGI
jgi:hypothetical protein